MECVRRSHEYGFVSLQIGSKKHSVSISYSGPYWNPGKSSRAVGADCPLFRRVRGAESDLQRVRFDGREGRESGGWLGLSDLRLGCWRVWAGRAGTLAAGPGAVSRAHWRRPSPVHGNIADHVGVALARLISLSTPPLLPDRAPTSTTTLFACILSLSSTSHSLLLFTQHCPTPSCTNFCVHFPLCLPHSLVFLRTPRTPSHRCPALPSTRLGPYPLTAGHGANRSPSTTRHHVYAPVPASPQSLLRSAFDCSSTR